MNCGSPGERTSTSVHARVVGNLLGAHRSCFFHCAIFFFFSFGSVIARRSAGGSPIFTLAVLSRSFIVRLFADGFVRSGSDVCGINGGGAAAASSAFNDGVATGPPNVGAAEATGAGAAASAGSGVSLQSQAICEQRSSPHAQPQSACGLTVWS